MRPFIVNHCHKKVDKLVNDQASQIKYEISTYQLIIADSRDGNVSKKVMGRSPQICTVTDFEMETSNFGLFLLISTVSVHFRAIHDETIHGQA